MAYPYNPYAQYPQYQQPQQQPITQPAQPVPTYTPQPTSNGITWVQGEAGAKSYMVPANNSILLMDSEDSRFYIKTSDMSGMPMPLRVFEYKELTQGNQSQQTIQTASTDYITRKEFDELRAIVSSIKSGGGAIVESAV